MQANPTQEEREARAGLSRCGEPGDAALATAVHALGAERVWELANGARPLDSDHQGAGDTLAKGLARWRTRAASADPGRDLENAGRLDGGFVIPGDEGWPSALDDLGPERPLGLWWRGPGFAALAELGRGPWGGSRMLSVVGTRDPSPYGLHVTGQLVTTLREHGVCILSGGALGVDVTAHRAALDTGADAPATICVLAGGVDRLYPAANSAVLGVIARRHLILSEHPPGCAPTRWRFLARNRIIAALSAGTVVTEGRWRSGALNTAHHAAGLGRWVGAVPGPVTANTSEGPHRLLREVDAELVSNPEDVVQALGWTQAAPQPQLPLEEARGVIDGLDPVEARLWEALPLHRAVELDRLLTAAGLAPAEALAGLQRLDAKGVVQETDPGCWRRSR